MTASDRLDETLLALADPTRRAILQRLAHGPGAEARVTEIAAPFAMSLNSVSKHIRILERARLLRRRTVGRDHYLSFDPRPLDEAAAWMEAERARWATRLDALAALLSAEDAAATAPRAAIERGARGDAARGRRLTASPRPRTRRTSSIDASRRRRKTR